MSKWYWIDVRVERSLLVEAEEDTPIEEVKETVEMWGEIGEWEFLGVEEADANRLEHEKMLADEVIPL